MEIVNYQKMDAGAYEHAIFDVYLGEKWGMALKGFCLCKSKQGNFYVKSSQFKDKRVLLGQQYIEAVDMKSERGKEFCKKILELLQPFIEKDQSADARKPINTGYEQEAIPF